jgi:CheY-like chemotaxis protein
MTRKTAKKSIVLYADDDQDDIELVVESFKKFSQNVEVYTFENGAELLSYADGLTKEDTRPCLVILDINMPMVNGKQTLLRLKKLDAFKKVPVILFSTSAMSSDKTFAESNGAGFVTKPLNIQQMEVIIEQFIDVCADEVRSSIRRQLS